MESPTVQKMLLLLLDVLLLLENPILHQQCWWMQSLQIKSFGSAKHARNI
jgi:hypothetical protein